MKEKEKNVVKRLVVRRGYVRRMEFRGFYLL